MRNTRTSRLHGSAAKAEYGNYFLSEFAEISTGILIVFIPYDFKLISLFNNSFQHNAHFEVDWFRHNSALILNFA